jgi:hypothetical protein
MRELDNILTQVKDGNLSIEEANDQILELFGEKQTIVNPDDDSPILVGHLNKAFGFNGFKLADIGTKVYIYRDRYYFELEPINDGKHIKQFFTKETLTPCIKFI